MFDTEKKTIGFCGQWGAGKTRALQIAEELIIKHGFLVEAVDDRVFFAQEAVAQVVQEGCEPLIQEDGSQLYDGQNVRVWLESGEELPIGDDPRLGTLKFGAKNDAVPRAGWASLGKRVSQGPIDADVLCYELAYGTNNKPIGENPLDHRMGVVLDNMLASGVSAGDLNLVVVEAEEKRRLERNRQRPDSIPAEVFLQYASDGGHLSFEEQVGFEEQGAVILTVENNGDFSEFKTGIENAVQQILVL